MSEINSIEAKAPPTYTLAIAIEFLGTHYHGWQRQREVLGVQEALETAIGKSRMRR